MGQLIGRVVGSMVHTRVEFQATGYRIHTDSHGRVILRAIYECFSTTASYNSESVWSLDAAQYLEWCDLFAEQEYRLGDAVETSRDQSNLHQG
jgi:hypothetical protein